MKPIRIVFPKRFCSDKCRLIAWALKEANKVMKKSLIVIFLLLFGSQSLIAQTITGMASYYGVEACQYNKTKECLMANGESLYGYTGQGDYAAMWNVPFGTKVRVTSQANQRSTVVTIRDRGPAKRLKRAIDLSPQAFARICNSNDGLCQVKVEVLYG